MKALAFLLALAPSFAFAAQLKPGDAIDVPRASGQALTLRVGARELSPLGPPAFIAYVGDVAAATVIDGGDEGLFVQLFEGFAGNARCVHQTVSRDAVRPAASAPAQAPRAAVPRVDVLVAYDQGARAFAAADGGGLTNFALAAVAKMNAVLANTGIDAAFRYCLVGVMAIDASAVNVKDALDKASARNPLPEWAPVKAERDRVGADVVAVLVNLGGEGAVTGAAHGLRQTGESPDIDPYFVVHADRAYCACSVHGVFKGQSMTHEVGHLLGAGHATALVGSHQDKRGPQLDPYSSGHYFTGEEDSQRYYTIMSYRSDGSDLVYVSAPFFSSPDHSFKGTVVGDGLHDNTATLERTGPHAARWRPVTVPARGEITFAPGARTHFAASVRVSLSVTGDAAAEIRYTTDGSTPTLDSPRYAAPLVFRETTTLKAAALVDGVFAPVYTVEYVRDGFGAAIGAADVAWTTCPDFPWTVDASDAGGTVRSGDGGALYSPPSELWTTLAGPATVRFRYRTQCLNDYATFRVSVDGAALFEPEKESIYQPAWQDVELAIPEGAHELRFRFALEDGGRWPEDSLDVEYNGVWLTGLEISGAPRPPETDTPVRVPHAWLDQYPDILGAAGGDYDAAARSVGANGLALWESYLAGLVPTDAQSTFRALIAMRDGKPVVTWTPDLGDARGYTVYGARNLGEAWQQVTDAPQDFRFFRVTVALPPRP